MGLILNFNEHASRSLDRASRVSAGGSAEIVIFPGVRYERWEDGNEDEGMSRKRDRIELPD
jgi:hypothetical protein